MANTWTYPTWVDWNQDDEWTEYPRDDPATTNSGFEFGTTSGWTTSVPGYTPATSLTAVTTHPHGGTYCGYVTWPNAGSAGSAVGYTFSGLTVGVHYKAAIWCWVPAGSPVVEVVVSGIGTGFWTSTNDQWQYISMALAFVATSTSHIVGVHKPGSGGSGTHVYIDDVWLNEFGVGDVVNHRLRTDTPVHVQYGRDQARALGPISPGEASFAVDNPDGLYSPERSDSPIAPLLRPGLPFTTSANHGTYGWILLFHGGLDDFDLAAGQADKKVTFTAVDEMARLQQTTIHTGVYQGKRTGELINIVLDQVEWTPGFWGRDIDPGATQVQFWWADGISAFDAIQQLVASEGLPAMAWVSTGGGFLFRDRHHRITRSASLTSQATFTDHVDAGGEYRYALPLGYDHGWREIVNDVAWEVKQYAVGQEEVVWEAPGPIHLDPYAVVPIEAHLNDPAVNVPTPGEWAWSDPERYEPDPPGYPPGDDYRITGDDAPGTTTHSVSINRTSGQTITVTFQAYAEGFTVTDLRLRGYPVTESGTTTVRALDDDSVGFHGRHKSPDSVAPEWAGPGDAQAIADLTVAAFKNRRSVVTVVLPGVDDAMINQQVTRLLSDRVTVENAEIGLDATGGNQFHIEQVTHDIQVRAGDSRHTTTFACGKVVTPLDNPADVFRFDTAGHGFDQGKFAH